MTLTLHWERQIQINRMTLRWPLTNVMHLSCPSCGVRNTLFHPMKTGPRNEQYGLVTQRYQSLYATAVLSQEVHRQPSWEAA
jgi:hypothetical protein